MSQCMDLKASRGLGYSRMGSRLTQKTSSLKDVSGQCSNHVRCSTGICSTVVRGTDSIAKFKTLTTFSSIGPSIDHQNPLPAQVNQSLPQKRVIAKRITRKVKTDVSKCTRKQLETVDAQSVHELPSFLKVANSVTLQNLSDDGIGILGTCGAILSKGARKQIKQRPEYRSFYAPTISSTLRLIASMDAKKASKSCSQGAGTGAKKCDLKKNSSSISKVIPSSISKVIPSSFSKVIPSSCSHSISVPSRRDTIASKLYLEGESSASRIKRTSALSNRKLLESQNTRLYTSTTLRASSTINRSKINDLLAVVEPLEHSRRGTTRGLPAKGNPRLLVREAIVAQVPATKISSLGASRSYSRSLGNKLSNVSGRKNFSRRKARRRPTSSPALGSIVALCDSSANTDAHSCNNNEGIVEPPMILERTEHHQERTYQRILESESNLSLGRLDYHDQHREMRMDIDNMSYEELLELEEKIGSVSTGLTDEVLTKCLKRSNFKRAHYPFEITDCLEDGNRCSICQEDCADGEEIGALPCEHWYHVDCIQQWLKQKNWCPICKSSACANC